MTPPDRSGARARKTAYTTWPAFALGLAMSLASVSSAGAQGLESKAAEALLIDADTGTVLLSKDADRPFAPAALTKLMTMEVVFHALKTGSRHLDETFVVSENAWRTGGAPSGGSTMFARLNSTVSLNDLIQGAIVQSANDACIVIAEGIAGSEADFALLMNERAKEIGLRASVFKNATGLPAEGQVATARDLLTLAMHIHREYPEFYKYYAQPDFTWNKITQRNRNPLLAMGIAADGMGTGYTDASGYAVVGSVERDGRRLFGVLGGFASAKDRATEARATFEWGLRSFRKIELFGADATIGNVEIFGGDKPTLAVRTKEPVQVLLPAKTSAKISARIRYDGPVAAPVMEGAQIAELEVLVGDHVSLEKPLYAAETLGRGDLPRRAADALAELLTGWLRKRPSS